MTFEDAYHQHRADVRRWVVWRFGEEIADDATQEGFLYAWENWETGKTAQNLKAWLIGVTKYSVLHMLRPSTRARSDTSTLKIAPFWGRAGAKTEPWDAESDERAEEPQQGLALYVAQLREHFGSLGPAQRDVMNALADGDTPSEIAAKTGRSLSATTMAISLGRKRLREKLAVD